MKTLAGTIVTLVLAVVLTPAQSAESVILWTGGITAEERDSAPENGTRLEFFVTSGNYLSNITVTVSDSNNQEIVNTITAGPWLILNLQPGTYTVQATRSNGDRQGGSIQVTGGTTKFSYMFPGE